MRLADTDPKYKILVFAAFILIALQISLIKFISFEAVVWCIVSLISGFLLINYISRLEISLIIISLLELVILNDSFNLNFDFIVMQNIFLYCLVLLYFIKIFSSDVSYNLPELFTPIIVFSAYIVILFIIGLIRGYEEYYIYYDLYQNLYLLLSIPIYYTVKNLKEYKKIFFTLILIFVIISLIYIYRNIEGIRFTTFHNGFFPLIFGIFYSLVLSYWKKNKIIVILSFIGILIIALASILSLTRTLWITNLISILSITFIYINHYTSSRVRFKKYIFYIIICLFPFIFFADRKEPKTFTSNTEQRLQSLSNVSEDMSFLMRIEISYYAFEKFLSSPIYGEGLGRRLQFKIFENTKPLFIDNSYFYYLWKGGIISLILLVWIYVRFYKRLFILMKSNLPLNRKALILSIFGGFNGILIYGLFSAVLVGYRLNFLYALCFAYVEYESQLIMKKNE